jgi:uncharacterized surface protein with fasciclin (FAS1) repeats
MHFVKFSLSLIIAGLVFFTACQPEEPGSQNIAELAKDTETLSSLVEALELTGLTSAFEGTNAQTVFAPSNQAFQDLLDSNTDWNELSDIDVATLTNVLLFHVVEGSVRAADLSNTYVNTLAKGPNDEAISLQISIDNGVVFNGTASPIDTDIEASNGVVHVIDNVMLPPNVVNIASNNADFSILVQALTRADLTTDYVSILTGDGPFTVFAPTNAAFVALLESNAEWSELADIPVATLEAVLNYHVVNGANVQSDELSDDQEITMLGGTTTVDLSSGAQLETTSNQSVGIVLTDVQGSNGVVHVVNEVLLP